MRLLNRDAKVEALSRCPLFEGLTKKDLAELARHSEDVEMPAGTVLCKEGTRGQEFFVIVDGEADVDRGGKVVQTLGPGDFFGEIALIDDVPRTAGVTAKSPLRFFVLTRGDFTRLLDASPAVERKVLRALARRVLPS
jgi:CRP-like cAMP-binding protein